VSKNLSYILAKSAEVRLQVDLKSLRSVAFSD